MDMRLRTYADSDTALVHWRNVMTVPKAARMVLQHHESKILEYGVVPVIAEDHTRLVRLKDMPLSLNMPSKLSICCTLVTISITPAT